MSDPYGSNPYGQQNPYGGGGPGGGGYGPPQGGGFGQTPPKTDGVSVASFVLSLLCCTSLIGLILGFVGLKRTKGGQRKGRGFAIAGIVLGLLGVIASVGGIAWFAIYASGNVSLDEAEVGQCVQIKDEDEGVVIREATCDEDHNGQIVGVKTLDEDAVQQFEDQMVAYCREFIEADDKEKLEAWVAEHPDNELEDNAVTDDPKNVETGDTVVCYVQTEDDISESIL